MSATRFLFQLAALPAACLLALATPAAAQNPLMDFLNRANIVRPGLGKDPGDPQGTPVSFPPGVRVDGKIEGLDTGGGCGGSTGTGDFAVQACLKLCNESGGTLTLVLPRGTTLISRSSGQYQNGVLIRDVKIPVPEVVCKKGAQDVARLDGRLAGAGFQLIRHTGPSQGATFQLARQDDAPEQGDFSVKLEAYCLNESMAPSEAGVTYELGPVTSDPDIRELLDMIPGRELDEDDRKVVQTAIYSITEGRGLSPQDLTDLGKL